MFEAIQLLKRIQEHFGQDCVCSIGLYEDVTCVSVSWKDSPEVLFPFDFSVDSMKSNLTDDLLEKLAIIHIENAHKLWTVGEI